MRTTITRTITVNKIHVAEITFKDGQLVAVELSTLEAYGNITQEQANKIARKKYGKNSNIAVAKIETIDQLYAITIDDFIKYAKPVDTDPEPDEQ